MTEIFRMNEAQPRLLDETRQGLVGKPLDRPEGPKKVSGRARYAAEGLPEDAAHGVLVRATIAQGRVTGFGHDAIRDIPGVIALITDDRLLRNPAQGMAGAAPCQPGSQVFYHGQPIALVVADSPETARDAAHRLPVSYDAGTAITDPATKSAQHSGEPETSGDFNAAFADCDVTVDATYTTDAQVAAAMEPHAAIADWQGDNLTLRGSLQMLRFNRDELADSLGIDPAQVRILSPYIGGGFGSKLGIGPEAVAAAIAAREIGRPVRVVMSRQTVFDAVLRRTETTQRVRFGATGDGRIRAISHDDLVSNAAGEEFFEPVSQASQFLYGAEGLSFTQTVATISRTPSGSVRAPGEAVGMLAFECAVDELAEALNLCPVDLRLRNIPDTHPMTGQAYSAHGLADCLRRGAEQFGWAERGAPGARVEGDWRIGMGVSSAARKSMLVQSAARVRLLGDRAVVETDMTDIGTGTYAILGQIAGEMLGLPISSVEVILGDTDLPGASGSGGSFGANSAGSATFLAAKKIRATIADKLGCDPAELHLQDGIARGGNVERPLADLVDGEIVQEAVVAAGDTSKSHLSSGFGAHFAEVAVNQWTGETRVRRMLGVMAMGRILNEKTARSQALGGMIWGIGAALTEAVEHDPRTGHIVTRDLANYHVPAHADVPGDMKVVFLEERDDMGNPIQTKGIGELGISGAGAAVLNAIAHATGARVRNFPALPDRVVAAMEAAGV
ncbi:xanthine dehydrogenase [Salipiger aestuarii]|uniref:xanthine dehydrogenase family protein molybdopterin-binding subunit n=1 Tax=Salipiger aestuarii TaxID=568098 RepID=UPI00123949CE|nr:xanthine dehydrogenase family protein molybdopterin-binding subunit [Salipiger aestuarii]KAA8605346.1 xanthine dehydrogenase [Salipiger aestuarii]KAA8607774.1 xanthine dehydrogenase [Salipiger aestuarii]